MYSGRQRWAWLAILFLVAMSNYFDRHVVSVLLEPIKQEFHVSDAMLGLFSGLCFAVFYSVLGLPIARWADRGNRRSIITLALSVWSLMTVLCGMAQTFWQLALARVGVGVGEAGAIAPAQSLIVDYFPPDQRALALSIFTAAGTAGSVLAFGLGGYVAATYGWRSAFLLAGAPGLLLALIARIALAEPRLQLRARGAAVVSERTREALAMLWRKRSFRYGLLGCLLSFLVQYGGLVFFPSFLMRTMNVSLAEVGVKYGAVVAVASVVGTLCGGWLADHLGRRDVRWLAWLPGIACALSSPAYVLALFMNDFVFFMAVVFVAFALLVGGLPPIFAAIHAVCGGRRRATAIAVVLFVSTLLGGGIGPVATGALSDALSAWYGTDGLRYSLMFMVTLLVPCGALFVAFGSAMRNDLED